MKKYLIIFTLLLLPTFAFAQTAGTDVWSLWQYLFTIIGRLTQLFWILAVMAFLFGLVQFLQKADSPAEQKKAKDLMIGSIIAFTIAVSFWGLITFVVRSSSIGLDEETMNMDTITSKDY